MAHPVSAILLFKQHLLLATFELDPACTLVVLCRLQYRSQRSCQYRSQRIIELEFCKIRGDDRLLPYMGTTETATSSSFAVKYFGITGAFLSAFSRAPKLKRLQ